MIVVLYVCWLSFNECFDVNYDKYANEQCCVSQSLDNNTARRSTALSLTRLLPHDQLCFRTSNPNPRTTQLIAYDPCTTQITIVLPMYGATAP